MAFFPQYPNPQVGMGPDQSPIHGRDLDSGARPMTPMPDPKMDISPSQVPGAPQSPVKQPGNRRSIKEYLEEIKFMQSQGQGVVPTFTNIQGGPMDVTQGTIEGQDVQSYVDPEYVQGEGGALTRGAAHPVSEAQQTAFGQTGGEEEGPGVHWTDDGWANQRALRDSDEVMEALDQQLGRNANPEEQMLALNQYRVSLYEKQAGMWKDLKKKYPDASTNEILEGFKAGDFSRVMKAGENLFSEKSIQERSIDLVEEYQDYVKKEQEVPFNDETGEPFASAADYVEYYLSEYEENMTSILDLAAKRSRTGSPEGGQAGQPPADGENLDAILKDIPVKKGRDGKNYKVYQGRTFLVGE